MYRFFSIFIFILACIFFPFISYAAQTAGDLLNRQLDEKGISNSEQIIKSVDKVAGGSFSAIPLYDKIDFSSMPYAKISANKINYPACLVLTPEAVNYVFKGKPDSFQGSLRKYEFHIGEGLNKAARMIYPQVFEKITAASSLLAAGSDAIAIMPETVEFRFRMGGMIRPSLIASVKIRVGMYQGGVKFFEKIYEVKDVKKSSYTIFPSKKQEHKAISKAIIDALKQNAEEIGVIPQVIALLNKSSHPEVAAVPAVEEQNNKPAVNEQWVEDSSKYDFDESTEQWIRDNQHQVNRAENQSTRTLLKKEVAAASETETKEEPQEIEVVTVEPEAEDSYYAPLPEAYSFVPTELDKKRWAARKAQIELARIERKRENELIEYSDKLEKIRINEEYAKRLNDNNWVYNNAVTETVIDHGENIILAGKVIVLGIACVGPQAAAACAPVTGTMVSYGRFDSIAAGVGEGTAEYQRSGDITKAVTSGAVTGTVDFAAGWAGGKLAKGIGGEVVEGSKTIKNKISSTVRKRAFENTKKGTGNFIQGAFDTRIKSHIYKANKNMVRDGLKSAVVDGLGADAGKKLEKQIGIAGGTNDLVNDMLFGSPKDNSEEEGAE